MKRRRNSLVAIATMTMVATALPTVGTAQDAPDPAEVGAFSELFVEPTIQGTITDEECIEGTEERTGQERTLCKPAAGTIAMLPDGRLMYHNALEGTEEVQVSIVAEYGVDAINDQSRVLDLNGGDPTWLSPETVGGGATPDPSGEETFLPPGVGNDGGTFDYNDGALFCSDITMLPDGRLMAVGGTNYYSEPDVTTDSDQDSVVELEGLNETRIFDPATNDWTQTGSMTYGRWYPTVVTQADGHAFVASGVTKLLKPVYASHPFDSGRNVVQTETYDPDTGEWTVNGDADQDPEPFTNPASRSLPLYPRLHLLPNGDIFYNAAGQVYNPQGQAIDQALWNMAATYDPDTETWSDLGIPTTLDGGDDIGGFRGSTTSIMMTLKPDDDGAYSSADFLTAGGIVGTTPGTYVGQTHSRISTVTVDGDDASLASRSTGSLNAPRWYGQSVLLPDDSVMVFNGASADEVVNPGTGIPLLTTERFDPVTEEWVEMADQTNPRTYHNTAILLPDGRVLLGGHAPISTAYLNNTTLPFGTSPADRDPTFQFYSPTYMFEDRPDLGGLSGLFDNGATVTLETVDADTVTSAVIVRQPTLTHLVDGDQRQVEVPIESRGDGEVAITVPSAEVVPPGGYMVFLREENEDGELIPSEAKLVTIGEDATVPTDRFEGADRVETAIEVAVGSFDRADTVLLARSDNFPDALTGAPLAVAEAAPLLLTPPDALDEGVADAIAQLGATDVIVLGGEQAITPAVVADLEGRDLEVRRVAGDNRFSTAVAIAEELGDTATSAWLAKGVDADPARGWEDALSAAPVAAHQGQPIFLTATDVLPPETAAALTAQQVERLTIVGGRAAVSQTTAAAASAGRQSTRLGGADRYETSAIVHRVAIDVGMSADNLWIATGRNFPDSLAAGPAVAAAGDSLLLVDGLAFRNSERVKPRLEELAGTTNSVTVVGGESAIRAAVERAVLNLLRAE